MNKLTESRILIADDTIRNLQILGDVLEREGYQINVARDGQQAIDIATKVKPDLILLDVMMPEMDGFDVCGVLKGVPETAGIPIISLTAKVETEDIVRGFELGAVDYITKPFNTTELLVRVQNHLSIHLLQSALRESLDDIDRMRREQEAFLRHELNNRIAPIMGYADMLIEALEEERQKRWAASISTATQEMADLIRALRSLQDLETGTYELSRRRIPVEAILESVIDNLKASGTYEVDIAFAPAESGTEINVDVNLMNGVFLNLLKNAAEHVSSIEGETVVSVSVTKQYDKILISITKGGPPIPEDRLDSFFEKFNTQGKEGGTGLGTTYAALVTRAHGGDISVTSTLETGTTVTVSLGLA